LARSPDPRAATRASWLALPPEPWKNGGGVTRTLAADPAGRWRVSIADIDRAGPYSRFPGYDRVSVVLSGQGVVLQDEGVEPPAVALPAVALRPRAPAPFAGDRVLQSRLVGGPVRVLNLFVQRGAAQARVACLGGEGRACVAGSLPVSGERRTTRLVVAVDAGRFQVAPSGQQWALQAGEFAWSVGGSEALDAQAAEPDLLADGLNGPPSDAAFAVCLDIVVHARGAG